MAQTDKLRPLNGEVRFLFLVTSCQNCGAQIGTGTGFSPSAWTSLAVQFHQHSKLIFTLILSFKEQDSKAWEPSNGYQGAQARKVISHYFTSAGYSKQITFFLLHIPKFFLTPKMLYQKQKCAQPGNSRRVKIFCFHVINNASHSPPTHPVFAPSLRSSKG